MQAKTRYFVVWWVLFEYSSFNHFPKPSVHTESLEFLKKVWKYANTVSRPCRKVWKIKVKSGKNGKKVWIFSAKLNLCQLANLILITLSLQKRK